MKSVLSVSLGSVSRDHTVEVEILGEQFHISRRGTGGDFKKFVRTFRDFDGKVDAFGVGGAEFYMEVNGRKYPWKQLRQVRSAIVRSKVGDGNGVKHILGPLALDLLIEHGVTIRDKKAAMMAAVDRYGLACALVKAGCKVFFGDLCVIGIPIALRSIKTIDSLSTLAMPIVSRLPFSWIYPVGDDKKLGPGTFRSWCEEADLLVGDFLQIQANLPQNLRGKIIVTNTTTAQDVDELRARGLHILVTTTPRMNGRSFGTNVMEAVCRVLIDKPDDQITERDFVNTMARVPLRPQLEILKPN